MRRLGCVPVFIAVLLTTSDAELIEAVDAEDRFEQQAGAVEQVLIAEQMGLKLPARKRSDESFSMFRRDRGSKAAAKQRYYHN